MACYYNEIDAEKAETIRELIKAGVVAPGDVDERSIADVDGEELREYSQVHLFAGFAVWSYALRLAGVRDDERVLTLSCPCPSFSCAGKGEGFDDPRHLWPHGLRIIRQYRPTELYGEQVEAAIGHGWLDLVGMDLEAEGYALGAAVLSAAAVGAPHLRKRLYFCADAKNSDRRSGEWRAQEGTGPDAERGRGFAGGGASLGSSHTECDGGRTDFTLGQAQGRTADRGDCATGDLCDSTQRGLAMCGSASGHAGHLAFADATCRSDHSLSPRLEGHFGDVRDWRGPGWLDPITARSIAETGATRGYWADCDWWWGRDGKWRPIGPGLFPLAHGVAARVLKLRGAGDAICAQTAKAFIECYREARGK